MDKQFMADNDSIQEEENIVDGTAAIEEQDDFVVDDEIDDFQDIEGENDKVVEEDEDYEKTDASEDQVAKESEPPVSADNGTTEIDQTKAFSQRLNEKTAEIVQLAQKKIDDYLCAAYDGQVDQETGEVVSIKNEGDFKKWEEKTRLRHLAEKNGVTEDEAKELSADQKFIRDQRIAQQEQQKIVKAEIALQQKAAEDIQGFQEVYPDVNIEALMQNKAFMDYADGKLSQKPLASIYGGFIKLVGTAEEAAVAKTNAKKQRSTSSGSKSQRSILTPQQEQGRQEWNKKNPDCAISQKEFLELKKGI